MGEVVAQINEMPCDDDDNQEFDNLLEASEAVVDSNKEIDLVILPPQTVDSLSDEEAVEEDDLLPSNLPNDVPGRVAVFVRDEGNEGGVPTSQSKPKATKRQKVVEPVMPKWSNRVSYEHEIPSADLNNLVDQNPHLVELSPYELFCLYYDDRMKNLIMSESIRYARQKNNLQFELDEADLDVFVGVLLLSGYHSLPREKLYWNRDEDVRIPFVSSHMSRNRFMEIKKFIHLADNDAVIPTDKMYKVSSFISAFNARFQQFGIFHKYLSVDEEMVPYYGHHSAKMYLRGKPIRFGYKLWVLASDNGYPYNVQVYCGKTSGLPGIQPDNGLGYRVVTSLLACITNPLIHEVYFDNFFSSYILLSSLRDMNIKATGTVRENRLKSCPLTDSKQMKKKERGFYEAKCDRRLMAVKWNDNQCVTVATNFSTVEPLHKAKRWSSAKKASIDLPQPAAVHEYNLHMGGVDILDRFMSNYRPVFRSKKWWWPLFINGLNMAVVAAWRLHVEVSVVYNCK